MIRTEFEVRKIWDIDRSYNADGRLHGGLIPPGGEVHPDLIRYKGNWYCGFKESGRTRIVRSADGVKWETVKLIEWADGYVGDVRFCITAEGALLAMSWSGHPYTPSYPAASKAGDVRIASITWLTTDGIDWGTAHACPTGLGVCRYHATWHRGMGYSFAYMGPATLGSLYRTHDGKQWQLLADNLFPKDRIVGGIDPHDRGHPDLIAQGCSEAVLDFDPNDSTACGLVRAPSVLAFLGTAKPPYYNDWRWKRVTVDWDGKGVFEPPAKRLGTNMAQMGGPMLYRLKDGRLFAAGRIDASAELGKAEARVTLFWVDAKDGTLTRFAAFDGHGHYSGVVEHDGMLWVSCGNATQHNAYEVFLLKMKVPV